MAVVERREPFVAIVQTHPFEAAWASEAIFFLRVESSDPAATLTAKVQISADGVRWIDEGTEFAPIAGTGDYFVRVGHLGGWLRLDGTITGGTAAMSLTVQLALKE